MPKEYVHPDEEGGLRAIPSGQLAGEAVLHVLTLLSMVSQRYG